MKLVSSYRTITIESAITAEQFKAVDTLGLENTKGIVNDEDNVIFHITVNKSGGVAPNVIVFDGVTNNGNLYVTVCDSKIPEKPDAKRGYIESTYGPVLVKLAKVEQQIAEALTEQADAVANIADSITML